MPITTHTTVSIAKTLIWSHTRTATDRGGGSSLFDTSLLEHAIACTGINFSCSDSIMLAAARRKGVRRRRRLRPTAGHSETAGQNGPGSGRDFLGSRDVCALHTTRPRRRLHLGRRSRGGGQKCAATGRHAAHDRQSAKAKRAHVHRGGRCDTGASQRGGAARGERGPRGLDALRAPRTAFA